MFKHKRHKETIDILKKVFYKAIQSGKITDVLSSEIVTL
jgi:hypothetical protein